LNARKFRSLFLSARLQRVSLFCPDRKSTTPAAQRKEAQKEPAKEKCSPRPFRGGGQRYYGTNPREQETQGTVGFSPGHEGVAETSRDQSPQGPFSGATTSQHTPEPWPLAGKRGTFAGWPLFGPSPRKYATASDPREPVARPPIGVGQCRPRVIRKSSPSKKCEIQSENNQV